VAPAAVALLVGAALLAVVAARRGGAPEATSMRGVSELFIQTEMTTEDDEQHHDASSHEGGDHKALVLDQGMGFPVMGTRPSLFCWSVMNCKNPNEVETMKGQLRERIGIFGCDNVAVLSGCKINLGNGHRLPNGSYVQVTTWYNPAEPVPMGNFAAGDNTNSFKNTDIFIRAWNILVTSKAVFGHDWTVKADPDCVFFAYRLRWHLKKLTPESKKRPLYLKNCLYQGQAALYGSLEVFSELALKEYELKGKDCLNMPWQQWGEDQWVDTCMWQKLGGIPINDFKLVGDHRCMAAECEDTSRASFHDYKSWGSYKNCWDRSKMAEKMKESDNFCCTYSWNNTDPCNKCGSKVRPGGGFCGGSKGACQGCGQMAQWCKRNKDGNAEIA